MRASLVALPSAVWLALSAVVACGGETVAIPIAAAGGSSAEPADSGTGNADASGAGGAGQCVPGRRVLVDEVVNARDLGGTPLADGNTVACNELFRAAAPASLSPAGCAEFADLGINTVIDLRVEAEIASVPHSACVSEQATIIHAPMPVPYDVSPEDYIADLDAVDSVAASFAVLGDESAYPVYFHCTYGRDRSGVLAALVLLALGAQRDAIMTEYELTAVAGLSAFPASLEAVLDEIDRRGGVQAVLQAAGVTQNEIDVLRAQVVNR